MTENETVKMTELDYLTAVPHLQMIKAALPYVHVPEQKFFSVLVKAAELERTVELFKRKEDGAVGICSLKAEQNHSPFDMLNAMKPYGTAEEQEFIDLISNFLQGSKLYQSYQETMGTKETNNRPFPLEKLKNFLPPEQQSRLENAQLLMQTIQQMT